MARSAVPDVGIRSVSWTLKESVGFDRTKVPSRDWSGYPIIAFPGMPMVEIHPLDRPDEKSLGSGEASQRPTAAAVANAVNSALAVAFVTCLFPRSESGKQDDLIAEGVPDRVSDCPRQDS